MQIIKLFYDLETTGADVRRHSIHQIAGIIEVNDVVVESFDIRTRPHPKALYEDSALRVCGKTREQIEAYQPMVGGLRAFKAISGKYVDQFDKSQKIHLIGFNNRFFDDVFLRAWFEHNGDSSIGTWFWGDTIDVLPLASEYLLDRRATMPSFKLHRVAKTLGISTDKEELHDALYDVGITRQIYRIVTGREIEI